MAAIGFYHLTRTDVLQALPRLLGRTLEAGERAVVRSPDPARIAALDEALWLSAEPAWLPHASAPDDHPAWQPIWLTTGTDNPGRARFLFLLDGASASELDAYARVFDLFDGADPAAVDQARARWSTLRAAGHELSYWQQGERGWEKRS